MRNVRERPPVTPELLSRRVEKLTSILDVAKAMTAERNLDALLSLILSETAKVLEADRCSLFLLDRERNELWSRIAQGAANEIRFPVGTGIAGSVAALGDIVNIRDAYADPRFNPSFDQMSGYRTKSILCAPMRDTKGEITGVIQALNSAKRFFDAEDEELLLALGGQAAAAVENALLHDEIGRLFEGFVSASVVAIEARDPTTAGHSSRVADLTLTLAQSIEHVVTGSYGGTVFTRDELREIRYASLLHDFGKVGVREPILVKAQKLHPHELELLQQRFNLARKDRQLASYRRRVQALQDGRPLDEVEREEGARLAQELGELDTALEFLSACNKPTVLAQGGFETLSSLGQLTFEDSHGRTLPLIEPNELEVLAIPKGSLSAEERREIESHVTHTFRFLKQIPWTRALKRVPDIAHAHHERLDGNGYPRKLRTRDIPLPSKMMAISDVYDALTASDRPYKKAVPHEKALDILKAEAKGGLVDSELLDIFISADVAKRALGK